jgi:two-component system NtrC family sensor kinase
VGVGQENGEIGIGAYFDAGAQQVEVIVWDNGPGIPEKIRAEIFKPFFTTKPVGEGTGLGLHICYQVVERIKGTMTVESTEGEGTRFRVRLPVEKGSE